MNEYFELLTGTLKGQVFYQPRNWRILGVSLVIISILTAGILGFLSFSDYAARHEKQDWGITDIAYQH